ncbi:MAG: HEAT repeat domain-containing protein [Anaerolineae bacterium]|nr:HEAT repeat domain-containing protein [Anaerolineae bacterium]
MLREAGALLRQERLEILKEKEAQQQQERLERLIDALDEPENHDMAIYKINQIGIAAVDALIETLHHDDDVDARYGAARALGQIMAEQELKALDKGRTATVKALIQALADPEVAVRYWATDSLGRCRSKLAISPLRELLKSSHQGIREAAVRSLQAIGGKRAEEILTQHQNRKQGWLSRIW